MFLCHESSAVIFGKESAERGGDVQEASAEECALLVYSQPHLRRETEAATEWTSSCWIRSPSPDISPTPSEAITGKRPGNHVALDRRQIQSWPGKMAQQTTSPDTLTVPEVDNPHCPNPWLNEDLVKSLRENLLQQEKSKTARKSVSPKLSPVISPRNSPRLLRRMLLSSNIPKQRRFTVAHTW